MCSYNTTTKNQGVLVYHGVVNSELAKFSTPDLSGKKVSGHSMRKYNTQLGMFSFEYEAGRC